ncbi:MAG: carboxypeptidase regulatory-like domain-containing protein [Candidatus Micrarchaeota archaeon]|nr:carboxypeptidase regulatory-like domain-containing protein [Candidatus Micrarchaeota archaeon]
MAKKRSGYVIVLVAVVVLAIVAVFLLATRSPGTSQIENLSGADPYAHLGTASFALVAPSGVLANNSKFAGLAEQDYNFLYANSSNFSTVGKSSFIVIVANRSEPAYLQIAGMVLNSTALNSALNHTKGVIISRKDIWAAGQTVFLLIGYENSSTLSAALLTFFERRPVYAPKQMGVKFINFNGTNTISNLKKASNDPILDAYLDGSYELGPYDKWLSNYTYYEQFAYLVYWAPLPLGFGIGGNSSGQGLPMSASLCFPPPPPPDGTSLCIGEYFAMPMLQYGMTPPQAPQWNLGTGDCLWAEDCIDTEGWAASGLNPQLPYQEIPSVQYGFTGTGSPIPPSMTGTGGPLSPIDPVTWWNWGPGGSNLNTGGLFQYNITTTSQNALLMNASVEVFSTPYEETPFGNFTGYNSTNASVSYACGAGYCGAFFDYAIYALMNESSTLPPGMRAVNGSSTAVGPGKNYYALFDPVTLTAPKVVRTQSKTYYFSYWSVYSEVGTTQFHQTFNTSDATFQIVGPTQAQAVYTSSSAPGTVTIYTGFGGGFGAGGPSNGIAGVTVSLVGPNGQTAYSNITGTNGQLVTPVLAGGCYKVNAYKPGYALIAGPNPACVNGPTDVLVQTLGIFVYNISWPATYPYGAAPINSAMPVNLTMLYAQQGLLASGVILGLRTDSGSVSGTYPSPSNGTLCTRWFNGYNNQTACGNMKGYALGLTNNAAGADFVWHTGNTQGIYHLNFTPLVGAAGGPFPPLLGAGYAYWTYSIPVVVFSGSYPVTTLNVSLTNSTMHAAPNTPTSFTDNITVRLCNSFNIGLNRSLPCIPLTPYAANMTLRYIGDSPVNTIAVFMPDPAPANTKTLYDSTALRISLGGGVRKGVYVAKITASMATPNATYNVTVPLVIYVSMNGSIGSTTTTATSTSTTTTINGGSGYGALNVTVHYNGAPAGGAQVRAFSPGGQVYSGWYTGSNGEYDSGYTVVPGNYEVDATYNNITNSTNYVNVAAGAVTHVAIPIYGSVSSTTSTSTSTVSTSTSTTSTSSSSTTTVQQGYYACNTCYKVVIAGYTCPSACPTTISCSYGGFECT